MCGFHRVLLVVYIRQASVYRCRQFIVMYCRCDTVLTCILSTELYFCAVCDVLTASRWFAEHICRYVYFGDHFCSVFDKYL